MKVLLTGRNGQVGSEIIGLQDTCSFELITTGKDMLDIGEPDQVKQLMDDVQPDLVINAAAYTEVDRAETDAETAERVNHLGAAYLASACNQADIPLLHISTDYVYDGRKEIPYRENDSTSPNSVYGRSKLAGDRAVATHPQHLILRTAWIFGSHGQNFVKTMLRLGAVRDEIAVVNDQHGAPTWSRDIAETLIRITNRYADAQPIQWGIYHYTGCPSTTWYGFAQAIFQQAVDTGILQTTPTLIPIRSDQYPTAAIRPKHSTLNCYKIKLTFGITPADWQTGLRQVLLNWNKL